MRIELFGSAEAKLEEVIERLSIRYGLEDLTPEELIDALLDIAVDSVVLEQAASPPARDRLIALCGQKIMARG
jgi:hypothetical protein